MDVIYYDKTKDAFQRKTIHTWAKNNKLDYVIELHRNSFSSSSAKGAEVLIWHKFNASAKDSAVLTSLINCGYTNRGIKKRSDLQNINLMSKTNIGYNLVEIGFISNANDNKIFDTTLTILGQQLYIRLKDTGVKRLGVVYGHGQGDSGAVNGKRTESDDVRKIKITMPESDNTFLYWFYTHDAKGKKIKVTARKKDEIISLKGFGFNITRVIGHEDKFINGDKKQGIIKKGTAIYGRR